MVINAFTHPPLREMRSAIERFIVHDVRPVQAPRPRSNAQMTSIQGTYARATYRFQPNPERNPERMEIVLDDGRLYTQERNEPRLELIRVNEHHFRRVGEPAATIAILADDDGRIVYQGERENYIRIESADVN